MFLGFRTQHINFWPLATGRETPPPPGRETLPPPGQSPENLFVFMCLFLSWLWPWKRCRLTAKEGEKRQKTCISTANPAEKRHKTCISTANPATLDCRRNFHIRPVGDLGIFMIWGCARRAEKASCGETVVQKGVLESPLLLFPLKVFRCFQGKPYWGREETDSPKTPFWTTVSPHDAFSAPLARSDVRLPAMLENRGKSQHEEFCVTPPNPLPWHPHEELMLKLLWCISRSDLSSPWKPY